MRNSFLIALNDLRVFFSVRENWFGLLALPIFFTLLVGGASGSEPATRLRIDVIDLDVSLASEQLLTALRAANPSLYLCPLDDADEKLDCDLTPDAPLTVETAKERVSKSESAALVVIPAGYGVSMTTFEPVTLEYYSLGSLMTGDIVAVALDSAVQQVNSAVVAARTAGAVGDAFDGSTMFNDDADKAAFEQAVYTHAETLLASTPLTIVYEEVAVTAENRSTASTTGYGQSVPGMGAMFVMFTVLGALTTLVKERKQWTLQRLVMMPVSRTAIIGGKILAYFVMGLLQYAVVFVVGLVVGVNFGSSPLAILLVAGAFVLCITALTLALATWIKTEGQANGLSFLLSMTLAPLGGAWWPLEITPPVMQALGRLSPVSWAMDGFREVIFFGGGVGDVLVPLGVLLAASAVLFAIGVSRFQYE